MNERIIEENIEGIIDVTGRQRRCKPILGDLREMKGFWELKEETLDCPLWSLLMRLWTCCKTDRTMN